MGITFGTFISNILISSIIITIMSILLKTNKYICSKTIKIIFICILLNIFKMFFPVEFFFTKSVRIGVLLPALYGAIDKSLYTSNFNWFATLLIVWVGIAILKGIHTIHNHLYFRKLINMLPNVYLPQAKHILLQMGINKEKIKIKQMDGEPPRIIGLINPIILLPYSDLSDEELAFVLKHEIYHHKHYDLWLKGISEILEIVYWWNPFVYILRKQIHNVTELKNDLSITNSMDTYNQLEYLQCLLKMARIDIKESHFSLPFTAYDKSRIKQRFDVILHNKDRCSTINPLVFITLLFVISTFFFNFEPRFPVPNEAFSIEDINEAYFLYKDGSYYFIQEGVNMGVVNEPIRDFKIVNE